MRLSLWIAGVFILTLKMSVANTQCLPDDTIRQRINDIKADKNNYPVKIKLLSKLRASYLKCHPKPGPVYAEIEHRLGDFYNTLGDVGKAIAYTDTAVEINSRVHIAEPFLCNSFFNLGVFYKQLYLLNESKDYFNRSITIGRKFPDKYFIAAMAYEKLSFLYFQTGDYQQSIDIASAGLLFTRETKDTLGVAKLLAQKAQSETKLGSFRDAYESILKSLFLLRNYQKNEQLATSYSVYAYLLKATGKHQAATVFYKKAFELNRKLDNPEQFSRDLMDMGTVFGDDLGQEDMARACYRQGIQPATQSHDYYQIAGLYTNIGLTYWREGDYETSLAYYQKALNTLPINFKDKAYTRNPNSEMLRLIFNDYVASILLANKGECLLNLYEKECRKPVLNAALETFLLADKTVDMMRWNQYGQQSKLFWRSKTKHMYENAIEVCYLLNNAKQAYYFFEKSRAVLLNDQLSNSTPWKLVSLEDRNSEKKILVRLNSLKLQLLSASTSKDNYNALYNYWLSEQKKWEDQQTLLDKKYAGKLYFRENKVDSIPSIQKLLLHNKQSLIEYFNGDSAVYVLLITPVKTKIFKIAFPAYLHDTGNFLRYCSNAGLLNQYHEQYCALALQLYQRLFQPLHVQTRRVIISPGDIFIPFDALLDDPKSDSSFLIKKHAFSYVYSMRVLMHKDTTDMAIQGSAFLGIAPENYAPSLHLQPLTSSLASLQRIQRGFNSSLILHGNEANRRSLLSRLPEFRIVQIYSHAAADSSSMDPVLYMADSAVYLTDIQKLKLSHTALIVLSACNTGVGYTAVGEGIFSLSRGFRMAGIPSTVTNLWQADNQATYQLTEIFYKFIKMGMPKDVALQKAKLEFLKDDKTDHSLPYYWGATIVLGDTTALNTGANSNPVLHVLLLVGGLLLALILLLFFFFFVNRQKELKA
jgi:CHAT domain-containing protein/Tfp pilus assembly protein PilF